jgi:hypothetical protein
MSEMNSAYAQFLERRRHLNSGNGFEPEWMPEFLFPFQKHLVQWAVRMGRAAIFSDCGTGKSPMMLAWAENVRRHTCKPVLIITPLAVSFQAAQEAEKFGIEAAVSRDGSVLAPITITNYERLEHFDRNNFGGVVCDESSALKAFDGQRRKLVTDFMRKNRYRLLCTATAAPNDYIELGTSSEALGYLGYMDMLNRFFTNKMNNSATGRYRGQSAQWRFKGHAEEKFWEWVASWARAMRKPSDLGFSDKGFELPPLEYREHIVEGTSGPTDRLFDVEAHGLREAREELRRTLTERCEVAAEMLSDLSEGRHAVAWCNLNDESSLLTKLIPGAVELRGSDHADEKEEKLIAFSSGEIKTLVTKAGICGWGLNWQHAKRMTFMPTWSYEQYYQAIRRMWRFGQTESVRVDVVGTAGTKNVMAGLRRKARQADRVFDALTQHMKEATDVQIRRDDSHKNEMEVPSWLSA